VIVEQAATLTPRVKQPATSAIEQLGTGCQPLQSSAEQVQLRSSRERQHFCGPVGSGQVVTTSPCTTPVIVVDTPQEQKGVFVSLRQMYGVQSHIP
jgi:hypothetical protein